MQTRLKIDKFKEAQSDAFACQLFYFMMKCLVIYMLYKYDSPLHHNNTQLVVYSTLILMNSYMILTIGKQPGYATKAEEEELSFALAMNQQLCQICHCRKKMRMKHCYRCQKCVYKYDHHCPWIGGCVGQYNHSDFWIFMLTQTLQATYTLQLFILTRRKYPYNDKDGNYTGQYGAQTILIIFMVLYLLFVGCMFIFHSYLLFINLTSEEMIKSHKLTYMKGKSQPFNNGVLWNLKSALFHTRQEPIEWRDHLAIRDKQSTVFDNQYYVCC